MPKCKINGKEVEVPAGSTVIQAFKQAGEEIAHYCWHPALSVAGVCRMCMVQIEGMPRLQIGCNTEVKEGMVVTNQSPQVKDAVKWTLDFHLINHPLDCPICDQAGECGLQDQYMQFGKYDPEMSEPKVKKHKVVDLGPTVVLDSERCILCSRCVRFTEEVSKTSELGIFNRGDRSEIGTFDGKKLDNKYSLNTVDICPVGALTSRDFRFRQRVWYLKEHETICTGCSTGCSVKVYYNEEGAWRVRPRHNPKINGHWMCDEGRDVYKFVNKTHRLLSAQVTERGQTKTMRPGSAVAELAAQIKQWSDHHAEGVALVLTGQYSNEDYEALLDVFTTKFKCPNVYHWVNNPQTFDAFDGLLIRGDKNPNTKGLLAALDKYKMVRTWDDLVSRLNKGLIKSLIVAGPENQAAFPDMAEKLQLFGQAQNLVWLAASSHPDLAKISTPVWQVPIKTYFERSGTYINFQGQSQHIEGAGAIVEQAVSLREWAQGLATGELKAALSPLLSTKKVKVNQFTAVRGQL